MPQHIADLASDVPKIQTASTIQYHRAHIPDDCTNAIARRPPRNMRHMRHPSNLPLYIPNARQTHPKSRRIRDSLRPLFSVFTLGGESSPTSSSSFPSSSSSPPQPPPPTKTPSDNNRKQGPKGKVLQESQEKVPTPASQRPVKADKPTQYVRRDQRHAAIVEEMRSEGLLGAGPPKTKKRKGRDSPDLEKPLPPLVPSVTRRNSEERYWASVANDIARRASMLS